MARTKFDVDCAIIGGGPGGLVAALYLKRFRRRAVLFNSGIPRAGWIPRTHNLLGYDRGIGGRELLRRLSRQVDRLGLDRIQAQATVRRASSGFEVQYGPNESLSARTVVLATGIRDVQPELKNLQELRERGLLRYCSICDGFEFRDKPLAVLVRDDDGLEKALFLRNWSRNISVYAPEGLKIGSRRIEQLKRSSIRVFFCKGFEIEPVKSPLGILIKADEKKERYYRAAYVELGCQINDSAFRHLRGLGQVESGFLHTNFEQRLAIPGMFAVGDCVNLLGQISVAAGQAAVAATAIHTDLLD